MHRFRSPFFHWPSLLLAATLFGYTPSAAAHSAPTDHGTPATTTNAATTDSTALTAEHNGVTVSVQVAPADPARGDVTPDGVAHLFSGEDADLAVEIHATADGSPRSRRQIAAWIDMAGHAGLETSAELSCKQRAAVFARGSHAQHAMVDLNRFFVLVLNDDPTISVIDPMSNMAGITSLYTEVWLDSPGADWVKNADDRMLYVSMPDSGKVAFVDAVRFKVLAHPVAGDRPMRLALHPSGKTLWVGNDSPASKRSGVVVLDSTTGQRLALIPTGAGHHEIVFSPDGRRAFVSNRGAGTISVIDTATYRLIESVSTGPMPIAISLAADAERLFVADGKDGAIRVFETQKALKFVGQIQEKPGLGPLRITPDGRFGIVLNTFKSQTIVFDVQTLKVRHRFTVGTRPFQIAFTDGFVYIRSLDSELVTLIGLNELGSPNLPPTTSFGAGTAPGNWGKSLSLAGTISPAVRESAALVANWTDNTVYYYMEGMAAPMGNFQNYGHLPRGVTVVDRMLREESPGRYTAQVRLPEAGHYELILQLFDPVMVHCFPFQVASRVEEPEALRVDFMDTPDKVRAGGQIEVHFRLVGAKTGAVQRNLKTLQLMLYQLPGTGRHMVDVVPDADGTYVARMPVPRQGAYYTYVAIPTLHIGFMDLNPHSFAALTAP
ncbi:MAG: beta-propeller fold lactonase family protein [Nitrospirota bacterium]|nr:beta-propeller fold lactonase family protein [Nitrospirota bacterium]